jgi:hypothetical protein
VTPAAAAPPSRFAARPVDRIEVWPTSPELTDPADVPSDELPGLCSVTPVTVYLIERPDGQPP